jgi:hypothetical protein
VTGPGDRPTRLSSSSPRHGIAARLRAVLRLADRLARLRSRTRRSHDLKQLENRKHKAKCRTGNALQALSNGRAGPAAVPHPADASTIAFDALRAH